VCDRYTENGIDCCPTNDVYTLGSSLSAQIKQPVNIVANYLYITVDVRKYFFVIESLEFGTTCQLQ